MHMQSNINLKLDITKQLSVSVVRYIFSYSTLAPVLPPSALSQEVAKCLVHQYLCSLNDLH